MKLLKELLEADSYQPPKIKVGDEIKVGRFKNRKAIVKSITKDKHNQPVLKTNKGDHKLFKPRITKLEDLEENTEQFNRKEVDYKSSDYRLGYKHGRTNQTITLDELDDDGVDINTYECGRYDGWHNFPVGGKKKKKAIKK